MRSTIRNYLFRHIKRKITHCSACSDLNKYLEIEQGVDEFPAGFKQLIIPNEKLERQYGEEDLMKCGKCGSYYAYRTWSPGGSEDAFKTSTYESICPISFLEAEILLRENEEGLIRHLNHFPDPSGEEKRIHSWGIHYEREIIKTHSIEILEEGIDLLKTKAADKMQVYQEEAFKGEEEVAKIVNWQLYISKNIPSHVFISAIPLLTDKREKIKGEIASGINSSLIWDNTGRSEILLEIRNELEKTKPRDINIKNVLRTIRDILNPKPAVEFYIPGLIGGSCDTIRSLLEEIPGLIVTSYTNETMYTGAFINFEFENCDFSAQSDDIYYSWSFYVQGQCPNNILSKVISHCSKK